MSGGFAELIVWRESVALAAATVRSCGRLRGPGGAMASEQVIRAAESIPANIAEGYGRGVSRDCVRFLRVARGSADELESHLTVAEATGRLSPDAAERLISHVRRVRYLLDRFMASVDARSRQRASS